jgi:hypothetical protein
MTSRFRKFLLIFIIVWLLAGNFASAAVFTGLVPCGPGHTDYPVCTVCHLFMLISNIVDFITRTLMPPLAGLLFLAGGIMIIAAGASEKNYQTGKTIIINTAIGVFIVLAAWAIVHTLITTIGVTQVGDFVPGKWYQVNCSLK